MEAVQPSEEGERERDELGPVVQEEVRRLPEKYRAAVALCYEGLPWFTGAAVMAAALPDRRVLVVALLYAAGAHGIMTLNDFKSEEGDRRMGLLSLAAAALLVLAVASILLRGVIWPTSNTTAFQLPANLSWSGYVLHYTQTQHDEQGKAYQVEVYQDLGTNQMHIESRMQGTFDVVVVTDQQDMLGKDMMHHIAQKGQDVEAWAVDGSVFDLEELRQDLSTQRASYLGSGTFAGQKVYQIRASNGRILLLNMHYFPVNVLPTSANASTPMYSTCELMPVAQVSDSMWDMSVPADFHMGKLPARA